MQDQIESWIDQTIAAYSNKKKSCACFEKEFSGYYPAEFLEESYFVVVDKQPKPDFSELRAFGFSDFLDTEFSGITYKNTYFIVKGYENNISLHFHELIHVQQWKFLGASGFIFRYMREIASCGYDSAPLEVMAYNYQHKFEKKSPYQTCYRASQWECNNRIRLHPAAILSGCYTNSG